MAELWDYLKDEGMNILTTQDFVNLDELMEYIQTFDTTRVDQTLQNKILATVFLEPSTRTRLSFESAMLRLGGKVITVADGRSSSQTKGESLEDALKTIAQYSDGIVVRSPDSLGASGRWADFPVPIINAGDGPNHHPTQALLDVYTIWKRRKTLEDLKVCVVGDLKNSRAIRSFVDLIGRSSSNVIFTKNNVCAEQLPLRFEPLAPIHHLDNDEEFLNHLGEFDVLYLNRVQSERHIDKPNVFSMMALGFTFGNFSLTRRHLDEMKKDALVMNPGPRLHELPSEFDRDPRVVFFEQARNGVTVRMALLSTVMQ